MKTFLAILASSAAALAVQPLVLLLWAVFPYILLGAELPWAQVGLMCLIAVLYAVPFVIFLGVPLTLLLHRIGRLKWWPLALVGATAGAVFIGWNGPGGGAGFSSGGNWYGKYVDFIVDGKPTFYGWLSYLQSVASFALHGLAGATAYYLVWVRRMGPNNSPNTAPLRGAATE